MGKIEIQGLEVFAHHGVLPEEKALGQKFIVDATLFLSFDEAAAKDDLSASVHYGEVALAIQSFLQKESFDLIETAAERLCVDLLTSFPLLQGVRIRLSKPWAPVHLSLKTIAVCTELHWRPVLIALGSNLGDRAAYLDRAIASLEKLAGFRLQRVSSVYETEPVGVTDQKAFLNAVAYGESFLAPLNLLKKLQTIEDENDRRREQRWGPRTLDLDLLYVDDVISHDPVLTLPHPRLQDRAFVLEPAVEIAPNFVDPRFQKPLSSLYQELLQDQS